MSELQLAVHKSALHKSALDVQVGGGHYRRFTIQPVEFCEVNELNFCQSNIIKYVCRYKFKNGREDLEKAIHYGRLWIQLNDGWWCKVRRPYIGECLIKRKARCLPVITAEQFIGSNKLFGYEPLIIQLVTNAPSRKRVMKAIEKLERLMERFYPEVEWSPI